MKSKVCLFVGLGIGIAVVTALIVWACVSEYGNGYSEDQRRNWNEMVGVEIEDTSAISNVLSKRREKGDAPPWKLDFSKPPAVLPLEGMTLPGLERLADQGNGDACLELAFRAVSTSYFFDIYSTEKNVRKAVKSGRAGSDFLLRLLERKKTTGTCPSGNDVDGYADFLALLDQGDFLLGKVYVACLDKDDQEAMGTLESALRKRAEQGDLVALRNAGYLGILRKSVSMYHQNWRWGALEATGDDSWMMSEKIMEPIESGLDLFPDFINPGDRKISEMRQWIEKKIKSHYWASLQRSLDTPFAMLLKAAEQGDLHAKFLWNHYIILCQRPLSRDEWEKHLMYANELIEAGGIYRGSHPQYFDWESFKLERYFYKEEGIDNLWLTIKEQKDKEYSAFKKDINVSPSQHRMDMDALCDMNDFAISFVSDVDAFGDHKFNKDEQMHAYRLLEQAANEGSPHAMFALARLLNEGLVGEKDITRAWDLLQNVKDWCDGMKDKELAGSVSVSTGKNSSSGLDLHRAVEWQMMDIVSRHGDMPGMTEREAWELLLQIPYGDYGPFPWVKEQFEKKGFKVPDKKK